MDLLRWRGISADVSRERRHAAVVCGSGSASRDVGIQEAYQPMVGELCVLCTAKSHGNDWKSPCMDFEAADLPGEKNRKECGKIQMQYRLPVQAYWKAVKKQVDVFPENA